MAEFEETAFDVQDPFKRPEPVRPPAKPRRATPEDELAEARLSLESNAYFQALVGRLERDVAHLGDLPDLSIKQAGELSYAHRLLRQIAKDMARAIKQRE